MGESGTIDRKRLLIRPRPFMYGDRWPSHEQSLLCWKVRVHTANTRCRKAIVGRRQKKWCSEVCRKTTARPRDG